MVNLAVHQMGTVAKPINFKKMTTTDPTLFSEIEEVIKKLNPQTISQRS